MNKLNSFFILLLFSVSVFCQDIDSLYLEFRDNGRIEVVKELFKRLKEQGYAINSFEVTDRITVSEVEIELEMWMGNYFFRKERYLEVIELMDKVVKLSKEKNDSINLERAYYLIGFAYQRLGNISQALKYTTKSYELCETLGDEERLSSVINNIANIYQSNNQDSLAILFYQKSIDIERRLGRDQHLAIRLGNLSTSYVKQNRLDEALKLLVEALKLDRSGNRPDKIAARLTQLANVYTAMEKYQETKRCLEEAYTYFDQLNSFYGMAITLNKLGEIEYLSGSLKKASDYMEKAAYYAVKNGNRYVYQKIAKNIYLISKDRDPVKALKYYEESVAIKDSILGIETQKQINEFQVKYDTQQKEIEIVHQQSEIDKHRTKQYIYIGGLVVAGILLVLFIYIINLRSKRNEILTEANATKDKFFSIISHDLKNPAIAQRNALQQLVACADKWDANSLSKYYEELLKSADGQVELLCNLLKWAQIQTGSMVYVPTQFDLTFELRSDIALIKNITEQKRITFDVQIPSTTIITGDRNMLTTVVRNLLVNAVKFTDKGGRVLLEIKPEKNHRYTISVTDTGVGMSREQVEFLFSIDCQRPRTGTMGEQGCGLGLIVCKELLEKHGSVLHVESQEGKGSVFFFSI